MGLLDATIVQVAAPTIHASLGGAVADVKWFSTAYTLPFAVLLITGDRLGDIIGRRRVFRLGVPGFRLGSAACALAPSAGVLIGLRVVRGIAAAAFIPQAMGLIRAMFTGRELPRALGTIGPVMGLAAVCGPVLGGLLIHADLLGSSWRAVFLVNLPLAMLGTGADRLQPERGRPDLAIGPESGRPRRRAGRGGRLRPAPDAAPGGRVGGGPVQRRPGTRRRARHRRDWHHLP
jgi:MFS family permease